MKIYSITLEADNFIFIDEIQAASEEQAIELVKKKYNIEKIRCCIISYVKDAA